MNVLKKIIITFVIGMFLIPVFVFAEDKPTNDAPGTQIPKLDASETQDAPILQNNEVYPFWGPVCQRYTYSVTYLDQKGRAPEYMQIYFNGKMIDMEKEDPNNNDYKNGVKYIYKYVPTKIGSNFYYFEASNGVGKARAAIIDSPDNGPVLFDSDFKNNEIVLYDKENDKVTWNYPTHEEWVGGVALSDDGKYLAAKTSYHVYLFDTSKSEPLWVYDSSVDNMIGGDVKGGIDISADGSKIFAAIGSKALLFDKNSKIPAWEYSNNGQVSGSAYNVSISADGNYAASAMAGGGECDAGEGQCKEKDALIFWNTNSKDPLWRYQTEGNFHDVSISADGSYLASSTGCPDRSAYIFSRDSNEPIVQSEMLTKDSPVDEASISADGMYSVFGAESSDGGVFLFDRNSNNPIWKFPTPNGISVRALSMTPDSKYIGAATMAKGYAYIFSRDSNEPTDTWDVDASLGVEDIADDGSYIAVGGTDKKVHIFERGKSEQQSQFDLTEFVGELDVSGNGKYVAAGTSGSVYFFESLDIDNNSVSECAQIIEPSPKPTNYSADIAKPTNNKTGFDMPLKISGIIFILSLIISAVYLYLIKKDKITRNKMIASLLLIIILVSFGAALYFILVDNSNTHNVDSPNVVKSQDIQTDDSANTDDVNKNVEVANPEGESTSVINDSSSEGSSTTNDNVSGDSSSQNVIQQDPSGDNNSSENVIIQDETNGDSGNVINNTESNDGTSSDGGAGIVVD